MNSIFEPTNHRSIISHLLVALTWMLLCSSAAYSQDTSGNLSAQKRFEQAIDKGRELAKECRNISVRFFDDSLAKSYDWKQKWSVAAENLANHKPVIEQAAIDWFLECKKPDEELLKIAASVAIETYSAGNFEMTWNLMQKVRKFWPEQNDVKLLRTMALVAIKTNRFDYALDFIKNHPDAASSIEELESQLDKNMFILCPMLAKNWGAEDALREKEAEADDLPRVSIELETGEVIVELFENEAPNTVANFINLVESGYYENAVFHPVFEDVVAQAGIYYKSEKTPLNYIIENEARKPEARRHFVGSLSMISVAGGKRSSASAFAFTLLPNPDVDWDGTEDDTNLQTVFGRVVSGLQHVAAIPATAEFDEESKKQKDLKVEKYAVIKKATVIRKRDHEYKVEKIQRQEN